MHNKFNNYLKIKLELKYGKYLQYYLKHKVGLNIFSVFKLRKCFIVIEYNFGCLLKNG